MFRRDLTVPRRPPDAGKESRAVSGREEMAPRGMPSPKYPDKAPLRSSNRKMLKLTEKRREKVTQREGDVWIMCEWTLDEQFTRKLTTFPLDECSDQLYGKCCKMRQPLTLNDFHIQAPGNASSATKPL